MGFVCGSQNERPTDQLALEDDSDNHKTTQNGDQQHLQRVAPGKGVTEGIGDDPIKCATMLSSFARLI